MIARLMDDRLDMVVAARVHQEAAAYRPGHRTGNRLFTAFVASVFGSAFTDILSGYRVFSRRFVKSFPVLSRGFEIETELTVHALELELPVAEIPTPYYARPAGFGIQALDLARRPAHPRDHRSSSTAPSGRWRSSPPSASALATVSLGLAIPIVRDLSWSTGSCRAFPTAILSTGLMLLAFLSLRRRA